MTETKNNSNGEILTLAEVSRQTGYHPDYLGFLCRTGKLKGFRAGRNWMTTQNDVTEFIKNYKNGVNEVTDETGAKIAVHVENPRTSAVSQVSLNKLTESTGSANSAIQTLLPQPALIGSDANEELLSSAPVSTKYPELSNLKREVFQSLEGRMEKLQSNLSKLENSERQIQEESNKRNQNLLLPVALEQTKKPDLAEKFVSNFNLANNESSEGLPDNKADQAPLSPGNVKKLYGSFRKTPQSSLALVLAVVLISLLGLAGSVLWANFATQKQLAKKTNEEKIIYQGNQQLTISPPQTSTTTNQFFVTRPGGTQIINQLLGMNEAEVYSAIDNRLNQYLLEGKFIGPQGPQGPAGLSQGGPNITYVQPQATGGGTPGSLTGFTYLSATEFTVNNATVNNQLTVNGGAVFNGMTSIANLSVSNLNLGLAQGSVVFQGASGLTQDNSNFFYSASSTQLAVGTSTPASTAILELDSTSKGFLAPRMTAAQRDAIVSPATGLMIYNTDTNAYNVYNGTAWGAIGSGGGGSLSGGTAGYVARWTSSSTLSSGLFVDNGTVAGVNATSSSITFNIQGTAGSANDVFNVASSSASSFLVVKPSGKVGIGTSTPGQTLVVVGSTTITSLNSALPVRSTAAGLLFNGAIDLGSSDVSGVLLSSNGGIGTTTLGSLTVGTNLSISGGQNVLIGTSTQITLLGNPSFNAITVSGTTTLNGITYSWPASQAAGTFLKTDGSGNLIWSATAGGGAASSTGAVGNVQLAGSGGNLDADSLFTFDKILHRLAVGTTSTSSSLSLQGQPGTAPLITIASSSGSSLFQVASNGSTTISSLIAGPVRSTAAGLLFNGAIDLGSSDVSGVLGVSNGGIGTTTLGSLTSGNSFLTVTGGQNVLIGTSTSLSLSGNVIASVSTGTSGSIFNISTSTNSLTINLPFSSSVNTGQLQGTDWLTFNNKLSGSLSANQVVYATAASSTAGSNNFVWINTTQSLGINSTTPYASLVVQASSSAQTLPIFVVASTSGLSFLNVNTVGSTTIANLTSALPVRSTSGGSLFNGAIALGSSDVSGVLGVSNGGTGSSTLGTTLVGFVVNDANVTGSISSNTLTLGWSGLLPVSRGGTGATSLTASDVLFGNGANPIATTSSFTFNSATNVLTVTNASTSASTVSGPLFVTGQSTLANASSTGLTVTGSAFLASTTLTGVLTVSGSTTISSLTAGVVQSTASGNLFISAVALGTQVSGVLGASNGGTGTSTAPAVTGQLLAADGTGTKYAPTNLVAGTNITITTTTPGQITIAATDQFQGTVTGTGTNGQVAYFTSASALSSTAKLLFDGSVFGFNATSSTIGFNIQGTAGSNDILDISSSTGISVLRVTSNQRVGIGSTTPTATLVVQGTSSSPTLPVLVVASSSNAQLLTVLANGNVGINSSTPAAKLSVVGSSDIRQLIVQQNSTQNANAAEFQKSDGTVFGSVGGVDASANSTAGVFTFRDKGLAVDGTGGPVDYNYGAVVSIHADDAVPYLAKFYNETYSASIPVFSYYADNAGTFLQSTFGKDMRFTTNGLSRTDLEIDPNGKIGIGTTTPIAALQVTGQAINRTSANTMVDRGLYISSNPTGAANTLLATDYRALETSGYTLQLASTTAISQTYNALFNQTTVNTTTVATLANASNVYINGAPKSTSNLTITSSTALTIIGGTVSTTTNAYGLWLTAPTGATTANYAAIFNGGSVGIGSTSPAAVLGVQGTPGSTTDLLNISSSTNTSLLKVASNGSTTISSLTSALPIRSTSGGALFNGAIALGSSDVSGVLGASNGGTGTSTAPAVTGQLLAADGTGTKYAPTNLVAGTNITITTTTPGQITIAATDQFQGTVTGSGTNGQVAYFTSASALSSTAKLLFDGSVFGFNATSSTIGFNIQGTAGSNDILDISSSTGISVLRVTSNQRVGIGSTTPTATLVVQGTSTSPTLDVFRVASSSNTTLFTVTAGGNVGIGTSGPIYPLDINSANGIVAVRVTQTVGNSIGIYAKSSGDGSGGTTAVQGQVPTGGSALGTIIGIQGQALQSSTVAYGGHFTASGGTNSYGVYGAATSGNTANYGGYFTASGIANNNYGLVVAAGNVGLGSSTPTSAFLAIQGAAGSNDVVRVASSTGSILFNITSAGNVGIGTTTPGQTLVVVGSSTITTLNSALPVRSTSGGALFNGAIALGSSDVSGILGTTNGGTGTSTAPTVTGQLLAYDGTAAYAPTNLVAGTNITITTTTAGSITFAAAGSGLTGTGSGGAVARWTTTANLSFGQLFDDGTVAGVSATTSKVAFTIQGTTVNDNSANTTVSRGLYINPSITAATDYRALEIPSYTFNLSSTTAISQTYNALFNQTTVNTTTVATLANASNVYINGAPKSTSNLTITSSTALTIIGGTVSSTTNAYGLFLTAPSGAGNNYAAIFNGGNVGVGTSSPVATFSVGGNENINGSSTITTLNSALPVRSTSAGALFNGAIALGSSDVSGVLGVSNGGTGTSTAPTVTGQLLAADGTGAKYAPTNLVAGTNITITTSTAGQITFAAAGSGLSGSGTNGYSAIWNGATSLTNGAIIDNGTVAGIGATSSTVSFNIQGVSGSTNDIFNAATSTGTSILKVLATNGVVLGMRASSTNSTNSVGSAAPVLQLDSTALSSPSANGTYLGINTPSSPAFSGNFIDMQLAGASRFTLTSAGLATFGGNITSTGGTFSAGAVTITLKANSPASTANQTRISLTDGTGNNNPTSGTTIGVGIASLGFNPTSGTALYNEFQVLGTINQTSSANGITRMQYINPTLTSLYDFRDLEIAGVTATVSNAANPAQTIYNTLIGANTYQTNSTTAYTIANASTLSIAGAPIASTTSLTITSSTALTILSNNVTASTTNAQGLWVAAPTGATNNYAALFSGGSVGVGSTAPITTLAVRGSGTIDPFDVSSSTNTSILRVTATGNVGIGTTSPVAVFSVNGNEYISGSSTITTLNSALPVRSTSAGALFNGAIALGSSDVSGILAVGSGGTGSSTLGTTLVGFAVSDTNVTGTIANNTLTLGWSGQLSIARGGTNTSTAPTVQGQLLSYDGTAAYAPTTLVAGTNITITTTTKGSITIADPNALTTIGSGNNGFVAIWNGANSLTQGKLIDNGTVIGMNATSSTIGFNIQGTAGTNDILNIASSSGISILRVTANQRVGIGSTTPNATLVVQGTSTSPTLDVLTVASSTGAVMFNVAANGNVGVNTSSPVNAFSVSGKSLFTGHMAIGANASVDQNYPKVLNLRETFTDLSPSSVVGLQNFITLNPSSSVTSDAYGYYNQIFTTAGNTQNFNTINAAYNRVEHDASSTVSDAYGVQNSVITGTAATSSITNAYANSNAVGNHGIGTITNGYGVNIYSAVNDGGGTFVNNYGLYINDQSAVGSTNSYNLYSAGAAAKNYFQGLVGIGSTTPVANLVVQGTSGNTRDIFVVSSSTNTSLLKVASNGSTTISSLGAGLVRSTSGGSLYTDSTSYLSSIGSGNNGFVAIWNGANSLTQGKLIDNGTVIGMNATSSTIGFNIQGTAGTNDIFDVSSSTGISVLRVTANQRVGIGSTTPTATLVVQGTSTSPTLPVLVVASSSNAQLFTVLANGNVGIGSSTPRDKLVVLGTMSGGTYSNVHYNVLDLSWDAGANAAIVFTLDASSSPSKFLVGKQNTVGTGDTFFQALPAATGYGVLETWDGLGMVIGTGTSTPVIFRPNRNEVMRIMPSGNVGIGQVSPGSLLAVNGGTSIGSDYSTTAAPTNGMIIQGNVGIGTSSPSALLALNSASNDPSFFLFRAQTAQIETASTTVTSSTLTSDDNTWGGFTLRQVISTTTLSNTGLTPTKVTIKASSAITLNITNAYIGEASTTGDSYDFASAPTQLTFNGGNTSATVAAGGSITSDAITFTVQSGQNLIVSIYTSSTSGYRTGTTTGWNSYYKSVSDAATVDASGYALNGSNLPVGVNVVYVPTVLNSSGFALLNSGNVGIGTTTPVANLQVTGAAINRSSSNTTVDRGLYISPNPTGAANTLLATDYRALETSGYTLQLASTTAISQTYNALFNQTIVNTTTIATLANASNVYINGAPKSTSNLTITSSTALTIIGGTVSTTTNAIALYVTAPTGATNNYAALFSGGSVGIGSSTPIATLSVKGIAGSTNPFMVTSSTDAALLTILPNGNVGVGTSNPLGAFEVVGQCVAEDTKIKRRRKKKKTAPITGGGRNGENDNYNPDTTEGTGRGYSFAENLNRIMRHLNPSGPGFNFPSPEHQELSFKRLFETAQKLDRQADKSFFGHVVKNNYQYAPGFGNVETFGVQKVFVNSQEQSPGLSRVIKNVFVGRHMQPGFQSPFHVMPAVTQSVDERTRHAMVCKNSHLFQGKLFSEDFRRLLGQVAGKLQSGQDISFSDAVILLWDFVRAETRGQQVQDVNNGNSGATDAGFAETDILVYGDAIHKVSQLLINETGKNNYTAKDATKSKNGANSANSDYEDYIYDEIAVQHIQAGDEILSLNEETGKFEWQTVEKTKDTGVQEAYELVTESGKKIVTTSGHPYLVLADALHKEWKKVSQLKPGMFIATLDGWEQISSISHLGRRQMYDLQIANTHNFVGGHYVDVAKGRALTLEQEAVYYEYQKAQTSQKELGLTDRTAELLPFVAGAFNQGGQSQENYGRRKNRECEIRNVHRTLLPLAVVFAKSGGQCDEHQCENHDSDGEIDDEHMIYEVNDLVNEVSHRATIQDTTASAAPTRKDRAWNLPKIAGTTTEASNTVPTSVEMSDSLASKASDNFGGSNFMRHNYMTARDVLSSRLSYLKDKLLSLGVTPENVSFGGIVAHNTAIFDNRVDIGTTTPATTQLFVQGSGSNTPFTVASSSGTTLLSVAANGSTTISSLIAGPVRSTSAGLLFNGAITLSSASEVTGVLAIANGGTNTSTAPTVQGQLLSYDGTAAYAPTTLVAGTNVTITTTTKGSITIAASLGGGAISGSGTAGFAARFTDATTLAAAKLIDDGTVIGMNATSSTIGFNIQGTAGTNDILNVASSSGISILRVTANQRVGIGSTTPTATLVVQGTSTSPTLPVFTVASSSNSQLLTVLANGNVGVGTSNPTLAQLQVNKNLDIGQGLTSEASALSFTGTGGTSASFKGLNLDYTATPATNPTDYGIYLRQSIDGSTTGGSVTGVYSEINAEGTFQGQTISNIYGFKSRLASPSAYIGNAIGFYSSMGFDNFTNNASSTYGFYADYMGGFAGNNYGVYIDDLDGFDNSSKTWGIYDKEQKDYFAGSIGIGTTSPVAALTVVGSAINQSSANTAISRAFYVAPTSTIVTALTATDFRALEVAPYTFTLASTTAISQTYSALFNQTTVNTTTVATLANASNVYINGAPKSTSNLTITSSTALTIIGGTVSTTTNAYGLWLTAPTGATTANYAAIFNGGNVGIGTSSPIATFALTGTAGTNPLYIASSTGAALLTVLQSGNVGIGTAAPGANLAISGSGNVAISLGALDIAAVGSGGAYFSNAVSGDLILRNNNSQGILLGAGTGQSAIKISSSNLVSIGTTTSATRLSVTGTSAIDPFDISSTSGVSLLRVTQAGNVGIGTTTPGQALVVIGSSTVSSLNAANCDVLADASGGLYCGTNGGGSISGSGTTGYSAIWTSSSALGNGAIIDNGTVAGIGATSSTVSFNIQGTAGSANTIFNVASSTGTSIFAIKPTGLIGINTTTPNALLHIHGDASSTADSNFYTLGSTNPILQLGQKPLTSPSANGTYLAVNAPSSFSGNFVDMQSNGTSKFKVNSSGQTTLLDITSTGNLTMSAASAGIVDIRGSRSSGTGAGVYLNNNTTNFGPTSGNSQSVLLGVSSGNNPSFNPTSGTGVMNNFEIQGFIINQTSTASGVTRGEYINPTLTSTYDYRNLETAAVTNTVSNANPVSTLYNVLFNPITYQTSSTTKYTIANASTLTIAGAPIASTTSLTITSSTALSILSNAVTASTTNAIGLWVSAPTGATNNYAAIFNGGVGINTSTPVATLGIYGLAGSNDIFRIASSSNTILLNVTAAGNVGINTTTPNALLHIHGDASSTADSNFYTLGSTNPILQLGQKPLTSPSANGTYLAVNTPSTFSGNYIDMQNNGTSKFLVASTGQIQTAYGIGSDNGGSTYLKITGNMYSTNTGPNIALGGSSANRTPTANPNTAFNPAGNQFVLVGNTTGGNTQISNTSFAPTSGNATFANFEIQGLYINQTGSASGTTRGFYLNPGVISAYDYRNFESSATTTKLSASSTISTAYNFLINPFTYTSASATQVTLANASTLNIAGAPIGTTASTTISSSTALTIQGNALTNVTTGIGLYVTAPTGATNNYAAIFNGAVGINTSSPIATLGIYGLAGSNDIFRIASSSNTILLNVTAAGNVGIGTSTPTALLQIQGTSGSATQLFDIASSTGTSILHVSPNGRVGIGTTGPISALHVEGSTSATGANAIAGIYASTTLALTTNSGFEFGNRFISRVTGTATGTYDGLFVRMIDNNTATNTVRGIEVQAYSGSNTLGVNSGITSFGHTFGVQGITDGLAGGTAQPAGVFAELDHPTNGNAFRAYSNTSTTATLVDIFHETSAFTGTVLMMDIASTTGSFSSGNFLNMLNAGVSKFTVAASGTLALNFNAATSTFYAVCHDANGTGYSTLTDCAAAPTADYQEMYPTNPGVEAGDVLVASRTNFATTTQNDRVAILEKTVKGYDASIIGVASNPEDSGDFNSIGYNLPSAARPYPVALKGRVKVKVTNENGPVEVGDYLTSSAQFNGYAMKATRSGAVIGQALESFEGDPTVASSTTSAGKVMVFVETGYQVINNSFVLGQDDGQLNTQINTDGSQQINTDASGTVSSFLINQRGAGDILQLQQNGEDRLLIANNGSFNLFASSTIATSTILSVSNGTTTQFSITAAGHISVGKDTAGTATIKAGDNQAAVTFDTPYDVTPKVVITAQTLPNFYYGVATKTPEGFDIQINTPQDHDITFDWVALAQPQDTNSQSSSVALSVVASPLNPVTSLNPITPAVAGTSTTDSTVTPPADSTLTPSTDSTVTPPAETPPAPTAAAPAAAPTTP